MKKLFLSLVILGASIFFAPFIANNIFGSIMMLFLIFFIYVIILKSGEKETDWQKSYRENKEAKAYALQKCQRQGFTGIIDGKVYPSIPKPAWKKLVSDCREELRNTAEKIEVKNEELKLYKEAIKPDWKVNIFAWAFQISSILFSFYYIVVFCIKDEVSLKILIIGILIAIAILLIFSYSEYITELKIRSKPEFPGYRKIPKDPRWPETEAYELIDKNDHTKSPMFFKLKKGPMI